MSIQPYRIFTAAAACAAGLLLAVCVQGQDTQSDALVVHTTAGSLRGASRHGGGAEFLGIPYAEPPIGDLRWRAPLPAKSWTGVREAGTFGAPCAQPVLGDWNRHDAESGHEDCLYLNVITPAWPAKKPLPVMFWMHGGANAGGTASSPLYKDGTLPEHGVILVTINYRLGVFGFFAHPELTSESPHHSSGNYGLMDQILALHWVIDNIARFGGDPRNITVFGQSAGAVDTGMLMTSPLSKGLFQKAIAESGAPLSPPLDSLAAAEQRGTDAAAALHAPAGAPAIAFLRNIAAPELMNGLGARLTQWPGFAPDIDGWVIPRAPAQVFAAGQEAAIPLLLGMTVREFGGAEPPDALRQAIEQQTGEFAPRVLAVYGLAGDGQGLADPLYGSAADQWVADSIFHCPIATEAQWHSSARNPTYEYQFGHAIPGQEAQGAVHSSDLPYVFGYFPKTGNIAGRFSEVDFQLANQMETYWTNFARTGNPNSASLPVWPAFDEAQSHMEFTEDGHASPSGKPLRGPQCSLLREALERQLKQARP